MASEAYQTYQQLVRRIEAFAEVVRQRYPGQVTCHAGCDGCCYQTFTVFPVEAHRLAQAVASLTAKERQALWQRLTAPNHALQIVDEPQPCILLEQGRCRLYDGRPLICRMHGYPLYSEMIQRPDGRQRDCCPLNFSDVDMDDLDAQAIYNLDLVNQTLAAINHQFVQEKGCRDQRVTIKQAVIQALEDHA
ncbi:MAG: YkgJ family cysteine cluster protein [Candidatus Tectomicrobia bacterium]